MFDEKQFPVELEKDIRNIVTSPLLREDQKMNILDQRFYPKLVYPLQPTPVDLLESQFLEKVDMLIRQSVREICGLPADTSLYYTGRKYRNLGILQVVWEASLQHFSIAKTLLHINYVHFHAFRNTLQKQSHVENVKEIYPVLQREQCGMN